MNSSTLLRSAGATSSQIRRQGTNARLQEQTRQVRAAQTRERLVGKVRSASPRIGLVLLALAVLVGAGIFLFRTARDPKWTGLESFVVTGTHRLDASSVAAATGFHRGLSLVRMDLGAGLARISADPWIASASLSRSFPHTVEIKVREQVPVAVLRPGRWISADGTELPVRGEAGLPRLLTSGFPGGRVGKPELVPALVAIGEISRGGRTDFVATLLKDGSLAIDATGRPRLLVRPESWKLAFARWEVLERELGDKAASFSEVDLRHGSCAALRRAEGGT